MPVDRQVFPEVFSLFREELPEKLFKSDVLIYLDRSSQAFRYVLHYYRTGRLHVMEQLCALSFLQEIQYWGIDELSIDSCCRDRYQQGAAVGREGRRGW